MSEAFLEDRGVVEVEGEEARALLQRLITNDVEALKPGEARYAALLTPQGKVSVDFLVADRSSDSARPFPLGLSAPPRRGSRGRADPLSPARQGPRRRSQRRLWGAGVLAGTAGRSRMPSTATRAIPISDIGPSWPGHPSRPELQRRGRTRLRGASHRLRGPGRRIGFHLRRRLSRMMPISTA